MPPNETLQLLARLALSILSISLAAFALPR